MKTHGFANQNVTSVLFGFFVLLAMLALSLGVVQLMSSFAKREIEAPYMQSKLQERLDLRKQEEMERNIGN